MSKSATIYTKVDPLLKEQADVILNQLGISMSTAMEMFLQQIVLQRGIPFELKLPKAAPITLGNISDSEFNALMTEALHSVSDGKGIPFEEFDASVRKELGR